MIIGATGSGKSTLLKQFLPGLATGKVINGNLTKSVSNDKFAYVSQFVDNQIIMETPRDDLKFVLDNQGCTNNEIQLRITEVASFLGIIELLDKKITNLSGGQKQLINLAGALVLKPQVLLLDEPTAQLDPITSEKLLQMVRKVNQEFNMTIILVEHELEQAVQYANRLLVMEQGQILVDQPIEKGLQSIFDNLSYRNYLPQTDRLVLECNLLVDNRLPLDNRTLSRIVQQRKLDLEQVKYNESFDPGKIIFQVKNLNYRFEFNGRNIIDNVSFNLQQGGSYCIVGPNGTGKTTLLKTITQQLKKQSGKILFDGHKLKSDFSQHVFVLPQDPATIFMKDTVRAELNFQLEQNSSEYSLNEILDQFSLTKLVDTNPYDLSGGQQEFLALALGFIKNPEILFLDEPTKGLDPNKRYELGLMVKKFQKNGGTILTNSHDLLFAAEYFDRIAMMFDGKISEFTSPREFFCNKFFYTTEINKAVRDSFPMALTWKDIKKSES
ncbi:ABC transporter ATP-binding protein [Companilactobacillus nuruki]|nr:ATP-binding cassette domain-containing protein [Companilactobacillus nuruki]